MEKIFLNCVPKKEKKITLVWNIGVSFGWTISLINKQQQKTVWWNDVQIDSIALFLSDAYTTQRRGGGGKVLTADLELRSDFCVKNGFNEPL